MSSTVYLVMDQHGLQHRRYFADEVVAQAYADRRSVPMAPGWRPDSYIVVPYTVWDSLDELDQG